MRGAPGQSLCGVWLARAGLLIALIAVPGSPVRAQPVNDRVVTTGPSSPGAQSSRESLPLGQGASPSSARRDSQASPTATAGHMVQTVLTLGAVVGAILLAGAGVRRLARAKGGLLSQLGAGGRAPAGVLEVLGRYPISRGSTLVLLKLDRRVLLTCQTLGRKAGGPSMTTLCEITDPEEVASLLMKTREEEGDSLAKKFQAILSKEDAWPKPVLVGSRRDSKGSPVGDAAADTQPQDSEPLMVQVPTRRASEPPLSNAMSVLRRRVDSLGNSRQPLAKGGRA